jgi:hypothetical protein
MVRWIRARLSYANVASTLALFLALGTGTAYAANEWTGENIVDQSLTAADIQIGTIGTLRVQDNSLQAIDLAPDSVGASEIATNAVGGSEIAAGVVGGSEIAAGAVGTSEIANNTVSSADLAGGGATGAINITGGSIANGRCNEVDTSVSGAVAGDAVIFSIDGAAPEGVLFYGVRVPSNGHVTLKVCNFTGGVMPAITDLPVSVITITV